MKRYKVSFNTKFIIPYKGDVVVSASSEEEAIANAIDQILNTILIEDIENMGEPKVKEI